MRWAEYAQAASELAHVRGQEAARAARAAERSASARTELERLERRLTAQRDLLVRLAMRLREPRPSLDGVVRSGLLDTDAALRQAWRAVEHADEQARLAEERANQPVLFPRMSTTGRNTLVYTVAAVLAALASWVLWASSDTDLGSVPLSLIPWQLCGLPALAFFAGYATIAVFGRARLEPGNGPDRSVRLGGLICFVGMWLFWVLLVASSMG